MSAHCSFVARRERSDWIAIPAMTSNSICSRSRSTRAAAMSPVGSGYARSVATAGHLADGLVCDGVAASLPRLVVPLGTLRDRLKRVVVDHGGLLSGVAAVSGHWGGWRSRRVRQRTSPRRWRRGRDQSRSRSRMRGSSGFPLLCFGACVAGCECGGGQAWVVATSWVGVYGTVKASLTCTWPVI